MLIEDYRKTINSAFADNGLSGLLDEEKANKLYELSNLLVETNKSFNLTAITDENGIILKHFLDCATVSDHIPEGSSVIDVGCGAGFPTLPLAIIRKDIKITALDSTCKKISFVTKAAQELHLGNVMGVCARAEDFVKDNREKFDVCTSRAVARLNVLSELCFPLLETGGRFVAMKANKGSEEHLEAINGIEKLGGVFEATNNYVLSFMGECIERDIYLYTKIKPSPAQYPRKYSQIIKKPL